MLSGSDCYYFFRSMYWTVLSSYCVGYSCFGLIYLAMRVKCVVVNDDNTRVLSVFSF